MTGRSVVHANFTITRTWKVPPAKVFAAFADLTQKSRWFAKMPGGQILERSFDFREGGRETCKGRHPDGRVTNFDCVYRDIVENQRIVYSYVMHLEDRKISVSQACIELRPEGDGTKFVLTEYGDYLDGYDDAGSREYGTNGLMDALGTSIGG